MEYGLIGEHLGHSFSKEIHEALSGEEYTLREVAPDELVDFLTKREFRGINVTIPYKEAVLPFIDGISEEAAAIGAVNTIVNRSGKLIGYNTDYFGLKALVARSGITFARRNVLILGAGGAAKTAEALARDLGAGSVTHAVRNPRTEGQIAIGSIDSNNVYEILINATPVGMFPNCEGRIVNLSLFHHLQGVIDLVYNPLRSNLVLDARAAAIPAEGGLLMLVAQAVRAQEIFRDITLPEGTVEEIYAKQMRARSNIVLTGMPSSGKTTLGRMLSERTGRELIDTDEMVRKASGRSIPEIFATDGEMEFRRLECEAIREASALNSVIIATGGGAILDPANIGRLRRNGHIYLVNRDFERLTPTADRPLSQDSETLRRLFEVRRQAYLNAADTIIDNNGSPEEAIAQFDI
ncbi:MAG: hypothetical protein IKX03_01280 [Bacteroidales bacterium]|nr:hypothetical protein [Bacteroidales bacterium]